MKALNLRHKRIANGWTLEHVGQHIGLTKTAVQALETGKRKPSYDVLIKLCKLFTIPHEEVEQLFTVAADLVSELQLTKQ